MRLAAFCRKRDRLVKRITRHKTLIEKLKSEIGKFETSHKSYIHEIQVSTKDDVRIGPYILMVAQKLEKEVGHKNAQETSNKDKKTSEKKIESESDDDEEDEEESSDDDDTSSEDDDDDDSSEESEKDKSRKRKRDEEATQSKKIKKEKSSKKESKSSKKESKPSKKEPKEKEEAPKADIKLGNWNISELEGGSARQSKFMRLLGGGKKAADEIAKSGAKSSKSEAASVEEAIERQFQEGMARKSDGGGKRRGLGA